MLSKAELRRVLRETPSENVIEFFFQQANLSKTESKIILLHYKEGMTFFELSELLYVDVKTIQRRVGSGSKKLSAYLDGVRWLLEGILK